MIGRKKILVAAVILVTIGIPSYLILIRVKDKPSETPAQNTPTSIPEPQEQAAGFDKNMFKLDLPGSPWWVVNKKRALPAGYIPPDLGVPNVKLRLAASAEQMQFSKSATAALEEMFAAAKQDGVELVFGSGYRSEQLQRQFYNQYVAQDGQAAADRYSARPGTSEHQTGLAFDATASNGVCHLEACFATTPEGMWISSHAHDYGFIIRYPDGKEPVTGYEYEPWHLRYIGKDLSTEMHKTGIQTLEEFFNLPAAPTY